jgi:O-antigen ligase
MINHIINSKYSTYILASIIPFLAISIFISDLIFSFYSLLFLFYAIKTKFSFVKKNKFYLLFLYFYIVCILSSLFSENVIFSLKSSLFYIRAFFFLGLISYLVEENPEIKDIFYKFLFITFFIIIIFGLIEYNNFYHKPDHKLHDHPIRLNLFITNEGKLGSYLSRLYGLLLAFYFYRNSKCKFENYSFFLLSILVFITVFLSGERTSFFFISLFLFLCFFLLNGIKLETKILMSVLFLFSIVTITIYNEKIRVRMFLDDNNKLEISKDKVIIFTPQHTGHYKVAYKMFVTKPFLGHGPRMFRVLCSDDKFNNNENKSGCASHPHNNYLQLLAETGILGFLFLIICLFYIVYSIFSIFIKNFFSKNKNLNNYQISLILTLFITLWPFSPSGNFFNNWLTIIYTFPLAFYISEFYSKNKSNSKYSKL